MGVCQSDDKKKEDMLMDEEEDSKEPPASASSTSSSCSTGASSGGSSAGSQPQDADEPADEPPDPAPVEQEEDEIDPRFVEPETSAAPQIEPKTTAQRAVAGSKRTPLNGIPCGTSIVSSFPELAETKVTDQHRSFFSASDMSSGLTLE